MRLKTQFTLLWLVLLALATSAQVSRVAWGAQPDCEPSLSGSPEGESLRTLYQSVCDTSYSTNQCTEYWARSVAGLKSDEERKNALKKFSSCKIQDRGVIDQLGVSLGSCVSGLKDGAVDAITGIPKMLSAARQDRRDCTTDVEGKRARLSSFNSFLDPSERLTLQEAELTSIGCERFDAKLRRHGVLIERKRKNEYYETGNQNILDRPVPKSEAREQAPSLWFLAKKGLKDLGIREDCYSPEARTQMYCEMISALMTLPVGGAGAVKAAAGLRRLAAWSGKSLSEVEKLAKELQGLSHEERVRRATENTRALPNAKTEIAEAEARLKRPLSEVERSEILARENQARLLLAKDVLKRDLSPIERDAVILAHNTQEIAEKSRILAQAGIEAAERRVLIYEGVTGTFSQAPRLYVEAGRLSAQTGLNRGEALSSEAKQAWLKAAESYKTDLAARYPKGHADSVTRDIVRRAEDFLINKTPVARPDQAKYLSNYESNVLGTQRTYEDAAIAFLRAGKPAEARKMLEASPLGANFYGPNSKAFYIDEFFKTNSVSYPPAPKR